MERLPVACVPDTPLSVSLHPPPDAKQELDTVLVPTQLMFVDCPQATVVLSADIVTLLESACANDGSDSPSASTVNTSATVKQNTTAIGYRFSFIKTILVPPLWIELLQLDQSSAFEPLH